MVKVSIVVPFWRNSTTLHKVLAMIEENTRLPYEVIAVIDEDPLPAAITPHVAPWIMNGRLKIAWSPYPTGITRPCNIGMLMADGTHYAVLASDMKVSKYWLEHMLYMLTTHPEYGWILSQSNNNVASMACLMEIGLLKYLGGYDGAYFRGYEDTDMFNKMMRAGYTPKKCLDTSIVHSNEHARLQDPNEPEHQRRSREYFLSKWSQVKNAFYDWGSVPGEHSGWPGYDR